MAETLSWEILAKDRMSEVMDRLARASEKLDRSLNKTGDEAQTMGRKLASAEPSANKLSGGLDRLKSVAGGAVSFLASVAAASGFAMGTAAVAVGAFAVKTAADNETARVSFDLLLGSSQAAGKFLKDLQAFAAATPFDMPTLRDAASRLLAVGVNAKDVIPLMTRLGDATAGMGTGAEGINRAVYALQQMRQSGRVQLDDINQLTDAGIPALDALAHHMHTTVASVRDLISAGKVGADDLFAAIEGGEGHAFGRLKGMMDKQSVTLSGMWSTFKDNASQALAGAVEPALPKLKQLLDFGARAVPAAIAGVQEFMGKIRDIFKGSDVGDRFIASLKTLGGEIVPMVRHQIQDLVKVIAEHKDGLEKYGRYIAGTVIPLMGVVLKGTFLAVIEIIKDTIRVVAWLGAAWDAHKGQVHTALVFILDTVKVVFGGILHAAAAAWSWIPGIGPQLNDAARKFDSWVRDVNGMINRVTQTIPVDVHFTASGDIPGSVRQNRSNIRFFASGGPTPPGVMRVGENGPEDLYVNGPGYIKPNNQLTGGGGEGGGDMQVLAPVVLTLSGYNLWQGMLSFKRTSGKTTLGLA